MHSFSSKTQKHISVRRKSDGCIIRSVDVTGKDHNTIQKMIRGIKSTIDHSKYYVNGIR